MFRHGGENATKIGARLTLWGHTVVIDPITNSVAEAKVAACRRALGLIQENDPEWLVPPQPIDGPTTPDWNWIWMLEGELLFVMNPALGLMMLSRLVYGASLVSATVSTQQQWRPLAL